MNEARIEHLTHTYRDGLIDDTLPFWLKNALDPEYGGYFTALDQDGTVIDCDKSIWFQGRFAWLLSTLYSEVEPRQEWLDAATSGIKFLQKHGFDDDGKMFFLTTREGEPLRKRRYIASEAFTIAAYSAYARASGDAQTQEDAAKLMQGMLQLLNTPGLLEPKVNQTTRPMKGLVVPMLLIVTSQILRGDTNDEACTALISKSIDEIERDFMHPELDAILETVGPNGEFLEHYDGRTINPGHAIEAGWFILQESRLRGGDARLKEIALRIIDWSWKWGWDEEFGGMLYFRDIKNLPVGEYWHDMKFWWPHNETIIANLMAYVETGDEKYAKRHQLVHDWAYSHFPDPEQGEWFGYLHRDGTVSSRAKGTLWKGPFHIPRMQLVCWKLMEELKAKVL